MDEKQSSKDFEEQIVTLERVIQTLREEENVEVLLETTIAYLQSELTYQVIWLGLYDRLDHRLLGKGGVVPNSDVAFLKQRFVLNPGDLLEQVVIQLRPVGVPDLREENRAGEWKKAAQLYNIQGTIIFPLRYKDRCYGVALLGSDVWGYSPRTSEKAQLGLIFGELAASLYQIEITWQRQQTKRIDVPLLSILSQLEKIETLDQGLEVIVEATHRFLVPTRTNIYWFEREKRYFWRRLGNRQIGPMLGRTERGASGITVQDLGEFYQALLAEKIVWIGESHSSLKGEITGKLMQQMLVRSLLAAPILFEKELLGFLAIEAVESRIWLEDEKHYLNAVGQLLGLIMPRFEMEIKLQEKEAHQLLTSRIAQAIYDDDNWQNTLKNAAESLATFLSCDYFLLLHYDRNLGVFDCLYQYHSSHRRKINTPLKPLSPQDFLLLETMLPISIESWEDDRRFLTWKDSFIEVGIRSLIICGTGHKKPRKPPELTVLQEEFDNPFPISSLTDFGVESVLIIGHDRSRSWKITEQEMIEVVAHQLGLIAHQWELHQEISRSQKIHEVFQGITELLPRLHQVEELEREFLQLILEKMSISLAFFVTWKAGQNHGHIGHIVVTNPGFRVRKDVVIPINTDPLIQRILKTPKVFREPLNQLKEITRRWLWSPGINQILAVGLHTGSEHEITGILIIGIEKEQVFPLPYLDSLNLLVNQFSWYRRYLMIQSHLIAQKEELEWLNWYKQRRLEELYRTVGSGMKQLGELSLTSPGVKSEQKDTLSLLRYQQLLRQIGNALASTNLLLKQEQWRLHNNQDIIPVNNLLRRSQERVESLMKKSEVTLEIDKQNHAFGKIWNLKGDSLKLELVLYELLVISCRRCQEGGKIKISYQLFSEGLVQLIIIDNGTINPLLIQELNIGRPKDLLAHSTLEQYPGQHLLICQRLITQMGGQLSLEKLEDDSTCTHIILPIVTNS